MEPPPEERMECAKCLIQCSKTYLRLCTLCNAVEYCSDKCRSEDFKSHRAACRVKEKLLDLQLICAVCETDARHSAHICTSCTGIKYCSVKCMQANADEHKILCSAYANVQARPSKDHRLCLFFAVKKDKPKLIWLQCPDDEAELRSLDNLVIGAASGAPASRTEASMPYYQGPIGEDCRGCALTMVEGCRYKPNLGQNMSLGMVAIGHPSNAQYGPLAVSGSITLDGECEAGDVIPSDLPKLLNHFKVIDATRGSVDHGPRLYDGSELEAKFAKLMEWHKHEQ